MLLRLRSISCYTFLYFQKINTKGDEKMANMKKYSDMRDIGHLCAHYERSVPEGHYSNPNICEEKIKDDYNLAPDRGKQTDYIKFKINEITGGKKLRKDAVRMVCWIVNAPDNLPEEKKSVFFEETYKFLVNRYGKKSGMGEDICISAYVHKSETTDHIHFAFLPIIEKNGRKRFCAKDCVNRDDLISFHADLGSYLEKCGICKKTDILNGKTKRDSSGRALSVRELKKINNMDKKGEIDRWNNISDESSRERARTRGRW